MAGVLVRRGKDTQRHRGDTWRRRPYEDGDRERLEDASGEQAKDHREPPAAGRGKERFFPRAFRRAWPC